MTVKVYKHADCGTFTLYRAVLMPDVLPRGATPFETPVFARNPDAAQVIAKYVAHTGPFGEHSLRCGRG